MQSSAYAHEMTVVGLLRNIGYTLADELADVETAILVSVVPTCRNPEAHELSLATLDDPRPCCWDTCDAVRDGTLLVMLDAGLLFSSKGFIR